MEIRQATQQDALQLSSLCADVQRLHAQNHADIFKMPVREDFAVPYFTEMLTQVGTTVFIAEEGGNALGYIFCRLFERPENPFNFAMRYLLVEHISVRPRARGQGIGSALMAQAQSLAKELGVRKIQLESWDFNIGAHAFFESLGYRQFTFRFWREL